MSVQMKTMNLLIIAMTISVVSISQIVERPRPKEWNQLVDGARFIDRFLPMPAGKLSSDVWGDEKVIPRYIDNGIEDSVYSYWGGNIIKGEDNKYHLFVCGWLENSPKGHAYWPNSTVFHATSNNSIGPFKVEQTIGQGHNPEAYQLKDGRFIIYIIGGYYIAPSLNGPWTYSKFEFDNRDRNIIEGLSNLTFTKREDHSYLMICRGGGVWISKDGISVYHQISDKRVYPDVEGMFEDPVVWYDQVQYHLIVNDWLGRIAFYLRSKDGVNWVTDPGEAYTTGFSRHEDGTVEDWFKYERIKILQDQHRRAIQANFAVVDVLKNNDQGGDNHSSKNISVPLNPGLLLTIMANETVNGKPSIITKNKGIDVKITAEKGFNPAKDLDIKSLRFGASTEVNFGRGAKVIATRKSGKDLIVTFDAATSGITPDEFAPKLIGKTTTGKMTFGYARQPGIDYIEPILSARKPKFTADGKTLEIVVENFGQVASNEQTIKLYVQENGELKNIATTRIPKLSPYGKVTLNLIPSQTIEKGKTYNFQVEITTTTKPSLFTFTSQLEYN